MNNKLDTLHHIAIQVKDIDDSISWYRERFSCEIEYQDDTWAILKFTNISLALVLPDQHPYHFAIVCDDLAPYGDSIAHRDGTHSVYIHDIDGNHVEMLQLPKN